MEDLPKKYLFWAIAIFLVIFSYLIIKPYVIAVISAFILAYLIFPLYSKLNKKINKKLSAILCVALVLLVILIPLIFIFSTLAKQVYLFANTENFEIFFGKISDYASKLKIFFNYSDFINLEELIFNLLSRAFYYVPSIFVSFFITLFGVYYILIDWDKISLYLKKFVPFSEKEKVIEDISRATKSLVYGTFIIGVIEFAVAAIGFYFLGIKFYFILAGLVFLFAFIPGGPIIVWGPIFVYYLLNENYFVSFGVLLLGLVLSFFLDTLLRNSILSKNSEINPFIMLIGVLGGISLFGFFGFIIGPLILVYSIKLLERVVSK